MVIRQQMVTVTYSLPISRFYGEQTAPKAVACVNWFRCQAAIRLPGCRAAELPVPAYPASQTCCPPVRVRSMSKPAPSSSTCTFKSLPKPKSAPMQWRQPHDGPHGKRFLHHTIHCCLNFLRENDAPPNRCDENPPGCWFGACNYQNAIIKWGSIPDHPLQAAASATSSHAPDQFINQPVRVFQS